MKAGGERWEPLFGVVATDLSRTRGEAPPSTAATRLPQAGAEPGPEEESPFVAATVEEPQKERTPSLDWAGLLRRAFALDVFTCVRCGGRRRVLAYLTAPNGGRAILEHLELPSLPGRLAPAQGPPQSAWC